MDQLEDSEPPKRCSKEKFMFIRIKKNKDGTSEVVHCVDPDILCSEMKKKHQGFFFGTAFFQ